MLKRLGDIVDSLCTKWDCKLIEFNGEAAMRTFAIPILPTARVT